MKNTQRVGKSLLAASICTAVVLGAIGLTPQRAEARRPGPLCGPTILWLCTWSDGSQHAVGLTICDLQVYIKQHGATCVPY
jgi:hypothetical protein